nr:hypothetical protein [Allgaiera sp.]
MVDHNHDRHDSTLRERTEIRETRSGGGTGIAFIVGGLVVAVGIIAWLLFGGSMDGPRAHDGGGKTSISTKVEVGGAGGGAGAANSGGSTAKAGASTGTSTGGANTG